MKQKIAKQKDVKSQSGITLIALVITIIVLLILAGISINTLFGENGVLSKAKMAVKKNEDAKVTEEINMAWASCETAYRTAWAMDTGVERSQYYTKEAINKDLGDNGTVTALNYNENGESEITYQTKSGNTYGFRISETGEITKNQGLFLDCASSINLIKNDTEGTNIVATIVDVDGKKGTDILWTIIEGSDIITKTDVGTNESTSTIKVVPTGTEGTARIRVSCGEYSKEIIITSKAPMAYIENGKYYIYEGAKGEDITKENFGQYLGKRVNYVPSNLGTNTSHGTSGSYRIFYIDFDNKYQDGVGTIYLKADYDGKEVYLRNHGGYSSTDNYSVMKKLNPSWKYEQDMTLQSNDKFASWLCDQNVWTEWKDTTTISIKDNINYIAGSPSIEIYVDSYNAYLDAHPDLLKAGGTEPAEKLSCEYVSSGYNARGYRIGFLNTDKDNWNNTGYSIVDNSLIKATTKADRMYNTGGYMWLSSPSARSGFYVMMLGYNGSFIKGETGEIFSNSISICPLVSLKPEVKLTIVNE